jgi:hypothetical protein
MGSKVNYRHEVHDCSCDATSKALLVNVAIIFCADRDLIRERTETSPLSSNVQRQHTRTLGMAMRLYAPEL